MSAQYNVTVFSTNRKVLAAWMLVHYCVLRTEGGRRGRELLREEGPGLVSRQESLITSPAGEEQAAPMGQQMPFLTGHWATSGLRSVP